MGVFIISPNDKAESFMNRRKSFCELCAPSEADASLMTYTVLARVEVHTLSCGASRPSDFDEHVKALDYYDRIAETMARSRNV